MSAELLAAPDKGGGLIDVSGAVNCSGLSFAKNSRSATAARCWACSGVYVQPGVQFIVFYFALGVFLGLNKQPNFVIYMFSGIILVNFFSEAFG